MAVTPTDIATTVSEIPSDAKIVPTNALKTQLDNKANKDELTKAFYVSVSEGSDGNYTTNKTYAEILDTYSKGNAIYCLFNGELILPLFGINNEMVTFHLFAEASEVLIIIGSDNSVNMQIYPITAEQVGALSIEGGTLSGDVAAPNFIGNLSGTATYATNAGTASYSSNGAKATSATSARYATTAINAGTSNYATNAGTATYSTNASTAIYATNAGTATYSSDSEKATSATSATYATTATKAGTASTATYVNATSAVSKYYRVKDTNGNQAGQFYSNTAGTTANTGNSYLMIGNASASSAAGNAMGYLRLYSSGTAYAQFHTASLGANRTIVIPNASSTMALMSHLNRSEAVSSANTSSGTYMARGIAAGTGALTAGSTTRTNGAIYLQYE